MLALIVSRFGWVKIFHPEIRGIIMVGTELWGVLFKNSVESNHALLIGLCENAFGSAPCLFSSGALLGVSIGLAKNSVHHVLLLEERKRVSREQHGNTLDGVSQVPHVFVL
jgi:hypothetical protein